MIEVNLLPGGKKRSSKGRGISLKGLSLPRLGGGGGGGMPGDPYVLAAIGSAVVALGVMAYLFLGLRTDREEVQVALDAAVQDSVRFADLIARTGQLTARRDSIGQRVAIIQEIDAGRYVWPHIMDEVGRALPDYTWLRSIVQLQEDPLQIRVGGQAGSNFAITNFMRNLEASPFLRGVVLERSEQVQAEDSDDIIYEFEVTVNFEAPPLEELETIPLFDDAVSSVEAVAPDTAGAGGN